jgi:hypothetical protein
MGSSCGGLPMISSIGTPIISAALSLQAMTVPFMSCRSTPSSRASTTERWRCSLTRSATSARLRAVMSVAMAQTPLASPLASKIGNLMSK